MTEILGGAALTILIALGGAMLRVIFNYGSRLTKVEEHNRGREALDTERAKNTSSALQRIEQTVRRLDEKVDQILIKGVPRAVSQ